MLPSPEVVSRLLGALYDAAADPALWEPFLQKLAGNARAQAAGLVMHQVGQDAYAVTRSWEMDPEGVRLYQQQYGPLDIWARRGLSKPAGYVCTSEALCPLEELRGSEIYNDFMVRYGIEHGMFGVIESGGQRWAALSLYRDRSFSAFNNSDLDLLNFLTPHVQRAFRLHFQLSELKARTAGFERALEMLPAGVIFLGSKGEVVFANRAAVQMTSANDGLIITRKGLRTARSSESAQLEKLVAEAVSTSAGKGSSSAGGLLVCRKNGLPVHVLIAPVRNLCLDSTAAVCAVAFVNDPSRRVRPMQEILESLFRLTPAECRVALLLADGRGPREIAETTGVTANTMKSHLSSIYSKTSTSGQLQLGRLLSLLAIKPPQEA